MLGTHVHFYPYFTTYFTLSLERFSESCTESSHYFIPIILLLILDTCTFLLIHAHAHLCFLLVTKLDHIAFSVRTILFHELVKLSSYFTCLIFIMPVLWKNNKFLPLPLAILQHADLCFLQIKRLRVFHQLFISSEFDSFTQSLWLSYS